MKMYEDIPPFLLELMCGEAGIIEKNVHKWPTDMIVNIVVDQLTKTTSL